MLGKINPREIIRAHFAAMRRHDTGEIYYAELFTHIFLPVLFALVMAFLVGCATKETISIIVSASSIVAGLMLNLLVLVYTLAHNSKACQKTIPKLEEFQTVSKELTSTISYTVFICILLVASCFISLSSEKILAVIGNFLVAFFGMSALLSLLMVLKRSHALVQFDLGN